MPSRRPHEDRASLVDRPRWGSQRRARPDDSASDCSEDSDEGDLDPCRVLFDHVPWRASEAYLREQFEQVGTVVSLELWRRPDGLSAGKGSCEFAMFGAAKRAIKQLSGLYVYGRSMYVAAYRHSVAAEAKRKACGEAEVDWSGEAGNEREEGTRRVQFSNAHWMTTEGFLRSYFEELGQVTSFGLQRKADGTSLGSGSCEFETHMAAKRAVRKLHGICIDRRQLVVELDFDSQPRAALFFHNVSWSVSQTYLRREFEACGALRSFELRVKHDGRSLGMGWCEYQKARDAAVAIGKLSGKEIDGRTLFVCEYDPRGARRAFASDLEGKGQDPRQRGHFNFTRRLGV